MRYNTNKNQIKLNNSPILVMILLILFICLIIVKITRKKVIEYQISWKAENLDDEQEMDQLDQPTRPIKIRRSFDSGTLNNLVHLFQKLFYEYFQFFSKLLMSLSQRKILRPIQV